MRKRTARKLRAERKREGGSRAAAGQAEEEEEDEDDSGGRRDALQTPDITAPPTSNRKEELAELKTRRNKISLNHQQRRFCRRPHQDVPLYNPNKKAYVTAPVGP